MTFKALKNLRVAESLSRMWMIDLAPITYSEIPGAYYSLPTLHDIYIVCIVIANLRMNATPQSRSTPRTLKIMNDLRW